MKTNFEKWRDSLTPEALLSKRSDDTKCVYINCATNCPAENCPAKECWIIHPARHERWAHYAKQCNKWFLRWANAPAKEETNA